MWRLDQPAEPDPVIEAYKRDVDRTLLRENLRRTVEERIEALMRVQQLAQEFRRAGQRLRSWKCSSKSAAAATSDVVDIAPPIRLEEEHP
jgi:hypothetical protein